ncbi:hexaprenyldihydroxybenzoate methyltransferase [Lineolata rhizophorae]|uniref:Ubiquinone biosynthesis O-methyltransferase, mitochondrial n=1 Tax=Lineolata rhizophorae TaxID=578093 RepID=A0A6A6P9J1_9PEZI|nr:hexaprenyldihydroxybenzoate methyltransferase [Lineolata rhizophorae]
MASAGGRLALRGIRPPTKLPTLSPSRQLPVRICANPSSVPSARYTSTTTSQPPNESTEHETQSSVDPAEIRHFDGLASSWWDPYGTSRLLHLMNPLRHTFISRCRATSAKSASSAPSGQLRYLDVGCGGGIFAESAARLPGTASVTGVDPSPAVLAVARAHARRDPVLLEPGRLEYRNAAVEQLARPEGPGQQYDVVSLFEVLEHVSYPAPFLQSVMPHVKPGGWLVLSTIARTWTSWLTTKVVAEEVVRMVPRGTHDWSKYVNESELRAWFAKQPGWDNSQTMGVVYVPGMGWSEVRGGEGFGNYFFGVQKSIS